MRTSSNDEKIVGKETIHKISHIGEYEDIYDYYKHYTIILPLLQTLSENELNKLSKDITLYPVLQTIYKIQQKHNVEFNHEQFNFMCHVLSYVYQCPDVDWPLYY